MGALDFLRKGKPKITSRTAVMLTERGKKRAEEELSGGKSFAILSVLQDRHGMSRTISDIANETDIDIDEVKERVKILAQQGQVRLMSEFET